MLCKHCQNQTNNPKFCSKSCAAKYNNKHRTPESRKKQAVSVSITMKAIAERADYVPTPPKPTFCRVTFLTCKICSSIFYDKSWRQDHRVTCSKTCQITASTKRKYQNGSRKTIKYFNQYQNKEVILESSWELKIAELLDHCKIIWNRPDPIAWKDSNLKQRLYYPDFYLPKQNIYLDPKNPYCMELDKEKISVVSQEIELIVGDIELIKDYVSNLL